MIKLVVFDLAGTIVDAGCYGPVAAFTGAFADHGVAVTLDEVRGPMGLAKRDHLAVMLAEPALAERWVAAHGRLPQPEDLDSLYDAFIPRQLQAIGTHSDLVPGALELAQTLVGRGLALATTTGYFRDAAEPVWDALAAQGFPDAIHLCPDDVPAGRPAPWMIFEAMEIADVYPPSAVVKVGDTPVDVAEGLNAGVWSLGAVRYGSRVGCTPAEFDALDTVAKLERVAAAEAELREAGAHDVLSCVAELAAWIDAR